MQRLVVRRFQAGATLVEILVTFVLLSFALLALAGMQAFAVATSKTTLYRATASVLASEMADLIRANPKAIENKKFVLSGYLSDATAASSKDIKACSYPACSSDDLAQYDITNMKYRVRQALPGGGLQMAGDGASAELWIVWVEPKLYSSSLQDAEKDSDVCPAEAKTLSPRPRCLYLKVSG